MGKEVHNLFLVCVLSVVFILFSLGVVSATNCWMYTSSSTCTTGNGCTWKNDSWGSWCEELNCWSFYTQADCASAVVPGKNCTWQAGGFSYGCEKLNCWSLSGTSEASCENNTKGLNCEWNNYCSSTGPGGTSCWQHQNSSSCLSATGCSWGQCQDKGCWSYNTNSTCVVAKDWNGRNCTWQPFSSGSYCSCTLSNCPVYCNDYSDSASSCNAHSNSTDGCLWINGNCNENGCWKYSNESYCTTAQFCRDQSQDPEFVSTVQGHATGMG